MLFLTLSLFRCPALTVTNEVDGTFDSSSYDTTPSKWWGNYFATYFYDMYPQFTNHIYSVSRSGASWENQLESQQEKYCLPLWASFGKIPSYDWMLANDNSDYRSNDVVQWGTNLFNAPPLFWNGGAITNEGDIAAALEVTHYSLGGIPNDSADGDEGAVSRNAGAMTLAVKYHTPVVDMWHLLMTNGVAEDLTNSRLFGFYRGTSLSCRALVHGVVCAGGARGGYECWFAEVELDNGEGGYESLCGERYQRQRQHIDVHGAFRPDAALAWDVPDGTITNDARDAFLISPKLGNAFRWMIAVTNLPAGTYDVSVDGVLTDTATAAQLAAGRNWFTNYNGPLWAQRASVLKWKRYQEGVDPVTMEPHSAGDQGVLGLGDNWNFQSWASGQYDTFGKRGDVYLESIIGQVAQLRQYDNRINAEAQQTNHVLTVTLIGP